MGEDIANKPAFVIDATADEVVRRRLTFMERSVHEAPAAYQAALEKLGEQATAATITLDMKDERQPALAITPEGMIEEYFANRYDYDSSFDDATEDALAEDPAHRDLLARHRSTTELHIQYSSMTSGTRANPEAEASRNAVRRSRLGFFVGRVGLWADQHQAATARKAPTRRLRSTG